LPRSRALAAVCALAIGMSSVGVADTVRSQQTGTLPTLVATLPARDGAITPTDSAIPVASWLAAGDEDGDGPLEVTAVEEGYAPPGATNVAGIDYVGALPWQVANHVTDDSYIYGYATKPSYLPGQTIDLKVSTTAPTFDVSLWRYSDAADGSPFSLVAGQSGLTGVVGGARTMDATTHMIRTDWAVSAQIAVPDAAPSGVYLARLSSSANIQSYVPIVVRRAAAAKYLYVVPSMTWQAYNLWGGTSLYRWIGTPSAPARAPGRAQAVSYDRPYLSGDGFPLFGAEDMVIIKFLERNGYDVAYTTDTDLSIDPSHQPRPKAVIIGGHSEYWSTAMYDWLDANINRYGRFGLASFGANSGFWSCTMRNSGRTERCLKRGMSKTAPGIDNLRFMKRPEQAIFGAAFGVIAVGGGPIRLSAAAAATGLLKSTNLRAGSSLGLIAGYEVDQVHDRSQCGILRCKYDLKFATSTIQQRAIHCACPYNASPLHGHTMVRRLPSGRRVFAAGSLWWGYALDPTFAGLYKVPPGFPRLMKNILAFVAH
jgi:hypothetical protein